MRVLAIDAGSSKSAWLVLDSRRPASPILGGAITDNDELIGLFRDKHRQVIPTFDVLVVEWTAPRGMLASAQLFEMLCWLGRFIEALYPCNWDRVMRDDVKLHLLGRRNGKDAQIRQALIDRYGGVDGKEKAIGRKRSPGPLYGVSADLWAALAVGVTWLDQHAPPQADDWPSPDMVGPFSVNTDQSRTGE